MSLPTFDYWMKDAKELASHLTNLSTGDDYWRILQSMFEAMDGLASEVRSLQEAAQVQLTNANCKENGSGSQE